MTSELDLDAYLARIGFAGRFEPTLAAFEELHLAHNTHIPFENLDILLGRPIRLDLASIQDKLIRAKRGGYCFEQNTLFAAVLEKLGLPATFLAARVRFRTQRVLPRTHVFLLIEVDGMKWIADVGFGTVGLLKPIPLVAGPIAEQFGWAYRLVEEPDLWVLQTRQGNDWSDLYAFTLEPQFPVDLELANYYISTHPDSRFVQALVVQRSLTTQRYLLRNLDLIVDRGGEATSTTLRDQDELLEVLAESFELRFAVGTRFRIPS